MGCQCGFFYPFMWDQEFGMHMMALAFYQTQKFSRYRYKYVYIHDITKDHTIRPILGVMRIITNYPNGDTKGTMTLSLLYGVW